MNPIKFKEANKILKSPDILIGDLPIFTKEIKALSCWKMSILDRLKALFFGKVWVCLLLRDYIHPPIWVNIGRTELIKNKKKEGEG